MAYRWPASMLLAVLVLAGTAVQSCSNRFRSPVPDHPFKGRGRRG